MNTKTSLRRSLNNIADTLVVGLLITLASIPLVTGFAALRSGVVVLRDNNVKGNLMGRFVIALRQNLRRNLLTGTLLVAAAGIGSTDVAMAMTGELGLATVPVEVTGLILLLAVAVMPFWAAALPHPSPDTSLRKLMRHTVLVAAARPAHSAVLLAAVLAGTVAAATAPILAPIAVGVLARISGRLPIYELKLSANI